jgi:hypothetical protein
MQILLVNPKVKVALGFPPTVSFKITPKNLRAFNLSKGGSIKNAPSYNENVNRERGLPSPEARAWLRELHASIFGVMNGNLTMAHVKNAVNNL